jgi:two-component system, OmpR family, sensor histidine kinase ArlS
MNLRKRIILYFSITFAIVLGITSLSVFFSMDEYREQEFIQRLKEKTTTTLRLLIDVKEIDHDLLQALDETTINNLYDEKILLFDSAGHMIYSSVDDIVIPFSGDLLKRLQDGEIEISYREGNYDVYAHRMDDKGKTFFAIAKANDLYGKGKLTFLAWLLAGSFVLALLLEVSIALYISKQISDPITQLSTEVSHKNINDLSRITIPNTKDEIALLARSFNDMLTNVEQSYSYQKNLIHHISHELKTPIAVLISNIERMMTDPNRENWKDQFDFQKNGLMQMASVITTLLDISKFETNNDQFLKEQLHIDEIVFEVFESLKLLNPTANFELSIQDDIKDVEELTTKGNKRMLTIAFINLFKNAIAYSDNETVKVEISTSTEIIAINVINNGGTITNDEQEKLFEYFFRGENSRKKIGIGLGLVMVDKIAKLHHGSVNYSILANGENSFRLNLKKT